MCIDTSKGCRVAEALLNKVSRDVLAPGRNRVRLEVYIDSSTSADELLYALIG